MGQKTYWQYHHFSLCQDMDVGRNQKANYKTEIFQLGTGFVYQESAQKEQFFQDFNYVYKGPEADNVTGLAIKFIEKHADPQEQNLPL